MPSRKVNVDRETKAVKALAAQLGADLVGIADLKLFQDDYGNARALIESFPFAIAMAVCLSSPIIEGITENDPTPIYVHHCRTVFALLDDIAIRMANYCQRKGYRALPIPASQNLDYDNFFGAISHKAIAVLAGLGWLGKGTIVINRRFGPRIQLISVLTTLPLQPDIPLENNCGDCLECAKACPVAAIKGISFKLKPHLREEALDVKTCAQRVRSFAKNPRYGSSTCGVCVKACPFGRKVV